MNTEVIKLYDNREDVTLTTYVVDNSGEMLRDAKRPAILICPGGAYINCSDREAEPVALRFAAMGYHAFVLRYSTFNEGKQGFPDMSGEIDCNERAQYPNQIREIAKSFLIIRKHSEEWFVDTEKIAICGFSAGAHNCAMYSSYWNAPVITEYFKESPNVFKPAAVILGYALTDYIFMKEYLEKSDQIQKSLFGFSNLSFLGTKDPSDSLLDVVSPSRHVTENTPPTFLWATAGDNLVPVQHTIRMAHALADKKIPFEMHIFEEGDHGLSLATQATSGSKKDINQEVAKWVELADAWMEKRLKLPVPERTLLEEMIANGTFGQMN